MNVKSMYRSRTFIFWWEKNLVERLEQNEKI